MRDLEAACTALMAAEYKIRERDLEQLMELGLLNLKVAEQLLLRHEVEQLNRMGAGRCEAMIRTAEKWCCSYEKVRAAVYAKPPKRDRLPQKKPTLHLTTKD